MLLISTLLFLISVANAATVASAPDSKCETTKKYKIGVFVSTLSRSQVIFGYQLANVLHSDNHELVIIRPHINPDTYNFKPGNFKEIELDALKGNYELFANFSRAEHEIIFGDHGFFSKPMVALGSAFHKLIASACHEIISNKAFFDALKAEKFDFLYLNHHFKCSLAVAHALEVRHARFSSATLGGTLSRPFGLPQIPSIVPAWISPHTDQMTYMERVKNFILTQLETIEDLDFAGLVPMYREQFGPTFPTSWELSQKSELAFINDEEVFNYPRPISHKIIYIGGIGEELDKKTPRTLGQEYLTFINDRPTVLVSMGSVANSTEMPSTWKDQFKRLFETNPEIRFIWKYDGKDVETPENVFVGKWVPQIDLLKSGKVSLFLTHGGYNSLSESLYSATPMVLIPLFADQFRNANLAKQRGVGLVVEKPEFNADFISAQIKRILSNSSYQTNANKYQRLLQNKPFKAHELIIRWNRFLLENEPIDLNIKTVNFIQYYCLDIIIPFLIISTVVISWILIKLGRLYYWSCFGMGKKSAHLKRE